MFDFDIAVNLSAYIASFITIASIYFIALVSPGPDIALTIRNSLLHSRKTGISGAVGTSFGMLIHLTYTVFGIGYLVVNMPWLMLSIRIAGALYLLYLGYQSFKMAGLGVDEFDRDSGKEVPTISPFKAFRTSVINNLLNPMVILLFVGILSSYITPETPRVVQGLYGVMMISMTLSWFLFVAIFFSIDRIRLQFLKMGKWLERIAGSALILFGLKVFYLTAKSF